MAFNKRKFPLFLVILFLFAGVRGTAQEMQKEYAMPRLSPLYSPPPAPFHDNRILTVVFKTDPGTIQELVPKPLIPIPGNLMFIYVGHLNYADPTGGGFGYFEAGIGIPVFFSQKPGYYPACLFVDQVLPIIAGREIWGWPKKEAEITFREKDGEIQARVARSGTTLLSLSGKKENKIDPKLRQPELPWFLLKIIPSAGKDAPPDIQRLVSVKNIEVKTSELWQCTANLELGGDSSEIPGKIKVVEIVSAQFSVGDFTMDYGELLFDYLVRKE